MAGGKKKKRPNAASASDDLSKAGATQGNVPPKSGGSKMSRYVSFAMLVVTILVCGFYFFHVIHAFLLPLFLAVLLVVIFRPLHLWILELCQGRLTLASAISTIAIMSIVLLPFAGLLALAFQQANRQLREKETLFAKAVELRTSFGLQKPFSKTLDQIESELRKLENAFEANDPLVELTTEVDEAKTEIRLSVDALLQQTADACAALRYVETHLPAEERTTEIEPQYQALVDSLADRNVVTKLNDADFFRPNNVGNALGKQTEDRWKQEKMSLRALLIHPSPPSPSFMETLEAFELQLSQLDAERPRRKTLTDLQVTYDEFRTLLLGGPIWKWIVELVNPSEQQIDEWLGIAFRGKAVSWLPSITNTATSLIARLLMGLAIMAIGMFYFFIDGPKMIETAMHLSPLDDRHEAELLLEFDQVSRAVVLATLLSAIAQGILGGIGYQLFGMENVFLLMLLTAVLALIPFVGAAAVWVPCCLWLALVDKAYWQAGMLAVYGVAIISMADNVIKPWVLQGQSKLHPLLGLLSVLGGVQALGPIGILIGPMVVAFLQVLLTILQREISNLDAELGEAGD